MLSVREFCEIQFPAFALLYSKVIFQLENIFETKFSPQKHFVEINSQLLDEGGGINFSMGAMVKIRVLFFAPRVLFFRLGKKLFGSWNRSPRNRLHNCPSKHVTLKNTVSAKTQLKWLFLRGNIYFWCSKLIFFLGGFRPRTPVVTS